MPELLPDKTETFYGSDLIVRYLSDLGIVIKERRLALVDIVIGGD